MEEIDDMDKGEHANRRSAWSTRSTKVRDRQVVPLRERTNRKCCCSKWGVEPSKGTKMQYTAGGTNTVIVGREKVSPIQQGLHCKRF